MSNIFVLLMPRKFIHNGKCIAMTSDSRKSKKNYRKFLNWTINGKYLYPQQKVQDQGRVHLNPAWLSQLLNNCNNCYTCISDAPPPDFLGGTAPETVVQGAKFFSARKLLFVPHLTCTPMQNSSITAICTTERFLDEYKTQKL